MRRMSLTAVLTTLLLGSCTETLVVAMPPVSVPAVTQSLPDKCRHLYNVGRSSDWRHCMGVELK